MTGITFTSGADHDVYFMQPTGGGPIKIGISCDVRARLTTLRSFSPRGLELLAVIPGSAFREQLLMLHLDEFRMEGEWFQSRPEVWRVVIEAIDQGDLGWLARTCELASYEKVIGEAETICGSREAARQALRIGANTYGAYRRSKYQANWTVLAAHHLLVHGVGPAPDIVKSAA